MQTPPPLPVPVRAPSRAVGIGFWLIWSIDAIVAAVVLYFFFVGLADGSVSSFNMLLWLALLAGVGLVLRAKGKPHLGMVLCLFLAAPGLAFGVFFLVLISSHARWN